MRGLVLIPKYEPYETIVMEMKKFLELTGSEGLIFDNRKRNYKKIDHDIEEAMHEDDYDFIMSWYDDELYDNLSPLDAFGVPVIMHSGDHWNRLFDDRYKKEVERHDPDIILVVNKCAVPAFKDYLDRDDIEYCWIPYSIDPMYMKDYGKDKIYDVGYSGKFSNYIDRRGINMYLQGAHCKGKLIYKMFERVESKIDYFQRMNQCWLSYSSPQNEKLLKYKNIDISNCFSKNLEIPACKCGLITRRFADADSLGFIDGENCILFDNIRQFPKKLEYYLGDKDLLSKVIDKGYKLVHDWHTIDVHMENLIRDLKRKLK